MIGPRGVGERHIPERNSAIDGRWLIATGIERIHLIVRLVDDLEDALRRGESILLRIEIHSDLGNAERAEHDCQDGCKKGGKVYFPTYEQLRANIEDNCKSDENLG